jgi:hypothetical protein
MALAAEREHTDRTIKAEEKPLNFTTVFEFGHKVKNERST